MALAVFVVRTVFDDGEQIGPGQRGTNSAVGEGLHIGFGLVFDIAEFNCAHEIIAPQFHPGWGDDANVIVGADHRHGTRVG